VRKLALEFKVRDPWQFEAAAMLSQIGCIPMAGDAVRRYFGEEPAARPAGEPTPTHARVARQILERVPRLHTVAQIIERQYEGFETLANNSPEEYSITLGAQMLRVAIDFDQAVSQGRSFTDALGVLRRNAAEYNPEILTALTKAVRSATGSGETNTGDDGQPLPGYAQDPGIAERALP
jgi:hypothetical protein